MAAKAQGTWKVLGFAPSQVGNAIIGAPGSVTQVDAAQAYTLGTRLVAQDTGATAYGLAEFMYVKGCTSMAVKDALSISELNVAVRTTTGGPVGVFALAVSVIDAATKFGWVQVSGIGVATVGTVADNGPVFATASAGSLDDALVLGDDAVGAMFASATDTATALVHFPDGAVFEGARAAS